MRISQHKMARITPIASAKTVAQCRVFLEALDKSFQQHIQKMLAGKNQMLTENGSLTRKTKTSKRLRTKTTLKSFGELLMLNQ